MPIYEYACENCGHQLEAFQGIKDAPLVTCEQCQQPTLVKLVSAAGFRLKGGGWYETDFKSNQDKKRNLANNDSAAPSADTESSSIASKKNLANKEVGSSSTSDSSNTSGSGAANAGSSNAGSGSAAAAGSSSSSNSGTGSSSSSAGSSTNASSSASVGSGSSSNNSKK